MKKSSLKLVNYQFKKINCEWIEEGKQTEGQKGTILFDYKVLRNKKSPNLYRLDLFVSLLPKEDFQGYHIDTCIVGFFSFEESTTENEMEVLVRVNGISLLYSTLRGHISMLTSNFPKGSLILPSVIIQDIVENVEKKSLQEH